MKTGVKLTMLFALLMILESVWAHEVRPAYLQVQEVSPHVYSVLWKVPRTVDKVLDIQPRFEESFNLEELVPPRILEAFVLYTYELSGPNNLANTSLTINQLNTTGTDVLVQIRLLNGEQHSFLLQPTSNSVFIPESPGKWQVARTYIVLGVEHILMGFDHLLFVLALLIITSGFKNLLKTITAFTLAHSITLSFSALGLASLPGPPVEAVIALSILFLALEILKIQKGEPSLTSRKPWLVAFSFGLLHGFGFAGALESIGLPQSEIPLALAMFNIGVELGQIIFVLAVLGVMKITSSYLPKKGWIQKIPPYVIGSLAAFWLIERIAGF